MVNAKVHPRPVGGARPGRTVLTLVHAMVAGASHIGHAVDRREPGVDNGQELGRHDDRLRHGKVVTSGIGVSRLRPRRLWRRGRVTTTDGWPISDDDPATTTEDEYDRAADNGNNANRDGDDDDGAAGVSRGPYRARTGRDRKEPGRPSVGLAENIAAYRVLRRITQDELAMNITAIGHEMSRSTISAVESLGRNVTVNELFGFAICLGVTIGQLLDPTGPDHSRALGLDLGLTSGGGVPLPITPWTAHLMAASRAVVLLPTEEAADIEVAPAGDLPTAAQRELNHLQAGTSNERGRLSTAGSAPDHLELSDGAVTSGD